MLNVVVADRPGHFRDGLVQNLKRAKFSVVVLDAITEVPAALAGHKDPRVVLICAPSPLRSPEFIALRRVLNTCKTVKALVLGDDVGRLLLEATASAGASGMVLKTTPIELLKGTIELIAMGGHVFPSYPLLLRDTSDDTFPIAEAVRRLSPTELIVVKHVAQGRMNEEIVTAMGIALATVKAHLKHIHDKLGARSRAEVVSMCVGLLPLGVQRPRAAMRRKAMQAA